MDRIGSGDLMELASDVGPVPMNVGAVLLLEAGPDVDLAAAQAVLAKRVRAIPRLSQRLVDAPWGCGRPFWVDDPRFEVGTHVAVLRCAEPGDRAALLEAAVAAVTRPLLRSEPLWRAVFVTGLEGGRVALVVVVHHVLADGIGGLAVLGRLVDGAAGDAARTGPVRSGRTPAPSRGQLFAEARSTRLAWLRALGSRGALREGLGRLGAAVAELGGGRPASAPRCSLNAPTGPRRQVATVQVDLARVRAAAHGHGVTVNDVLLATVGGALATLLAQRGERVPALVVSVPVSARVSTSAGELGNRVGMMPVRVPLAGSLGTRLAQIAAITHAQKGRGASAALVAPMFRLLAALGLLRWLMDRQRLVNAFVTNLAGPSGRLAFGGLPIDELLPITGTAGNVSVSFAALSYAGTLTVSVIVDPDLVPDLSALATALDAELRTLG